MSKSQDKKAAKAAKRSGGTTTAKTVSAAPKAEAKAPKEGKGLPKMPPLPKMPSASRPRKPKPMVECACGCKGMTRGVWVPGHDARAKGWALRIERGICKIGDVPENEQQGAKHFLKLRKDTGTSGTITLAKGKKDTKEAKAEVKGKLVPAPAPAELGPIDANDDAASNE